MHFFMHFLPWRQCCGTDARALAVRQGALKAPVPGIGYCIVPISS